MSAAPKINPETGELSEEGVSAASQLKPFSQWLLEQRAGALHGELTDALAEVVKAVAEHEKPGTVTLKVTVKPGEDGADYLLVSDEVTAKPPTPPKSPALFFADARGNLSRNNPRQTQIPLRDIGGSKETPNV